MSGTRLIVFGVAAIVAIWASVSVGVNNAVEKVLFRESIDKASHWATYMAKEIPDIEGLIETGIPTAEQRNAINRIKELGDIFRFKLFDADGRLSLISDALDLEDYEGISSTSDPEPKLVAETLVAMAAVFDGTKKPDRPDLYAESYVPFFDSNGQILGVLEVYVDQTETGIYFKDSFKSFGQMVMLLCSVIFAVPSLAYYLQRILTERTRKDVEFLARFDPLTGAINRREFTTQAETYLAARELSVVCYVDLDKFKAINDTYGHSVGDLFLSHIAGILRDNCRKTDLVARFGGDEFVIGFHNVSQEHAIQRIRAILSQCAERVELDTTLVKASISVGVANVTPDDDLESTLKNADTALYYAKSAGRNTFAIYGDEMGEELKRRYAIEARIRQAVDSDEFEIYFQPLVSSKDDQVIGHEALLRLRDDDGTFIPPSEFVPMAEALGLIDEIGEWTIRRAIECVAAARDSKMIAINLSTLQFKSGDLVNIVRNALEDFSFPAEQLELEITESLLLEDSNFIEHQIDSLREIGVRIAMDDFGTGFSSLSYLWKYGFDRLKIDRSFVAALDENSDRSREIIESVVLLGGRLNMKITAEGVETYTQSEFLKKLGCDTLQGYLYGGPAPFGETEAPGEEVSKAQGVKTG